LELKVIAVKIMITLIGVFGIMMSLFGGYVLTCYYLRGLENVE
jgi:hypothetical protein